MSGKCGCGHAIDTMIIGLGPIGQRIAALAATKTSLHLVGAVDIAPALTGKTLRTLIGENMPDVSISQSLPALLANAKPQVALHATGSYLGKVYPQFAELLEAGISVVTTCEEISYPASADTERLLSQLDRIAKQNNACLLGTGINPGFAMDIWPLICSAVHEDWSSIKVRRVVDASLRREPLQRKVGTGMPAEQFNTLVHEKKLGHVGLRASSLMLAKGLGVVIKNEEEMIEPVIAKKALQTQYFSVSEGQVAGLHQNLLCTTSDGRSIELDLSMYIGADAPIDEISIHGQKRTSRIIVENGFPGDNATAAIAVNAVKPLLTLEPGYHTMLDLPFFGCLS